MATTHPSTSLRRFLPRSVKLIHGNLEGLDSLEVPDLLAFCFEDVRPFKGPLGFLDWRLSGRISNVAEEAFFGGTFHESLMLTVNRTLSVRRVFLVGLGTAQDFGRVRMQDTSFFAKRVLEQAGAKGYAVALPVMGAEADAAGTFAKQLCAVLSDAMSALVAP